MSEHPHAPLPHGIGPTDKRTFLPLSSRVLLSTLAVVFVIISAAVFLHLLELRNSDLAQAQARGDNLASLAARAVARPMFDYDYPLVGTLVDSMIAMDDVDGVAVFDPSGAIIAQAGTLSNGGIIIERPILADLRGRSQTVGLLKLSMTSRQADQDFGASALRAALGVVITFVILAGAIIVSFRALDVPISAIRDAMLSLAQGRSNLAIPGLERADEIGDMARALEVFRCHVSELERANQERARQKLVRENEARLTTMMDAMPIMVVALDRGDGTVLFANQRARNTLFPGGRLPQGCRLTALLTSGTVLAEGDWEWEFHPADGPAFWGRVQVRAMDLGDHPVFLAGITDETERHNREQQMTALVDQLTQTNTELDRFAFIAAHDLREPLRSVTSFAQLLERKLDGKLDQETQDLFARVSGAAKHMHALIGDLLTYSRVSAQTTQFTLTDANAACLYALDNLKQSVEEAGAQIHLSPLPLVPGDPIQLMQVFQNLIGNAVKFRHPQRVCTIEISASRQEKDWLFSVCDNGIGIAETSQDIFEIFRRLNGFQDYPGTGVGLAIAKRIVLRHGGRIWFERPEQGGSVFLFTIPAGS